MDSATTDVVQYPFTAERALDVDARYRDLQSRGAIKVQMAYGESCWLATTYEDVRTVHLDRRFSKAAGVGRDMPRREGIFPSDPSMLANLDPPEHTRLRRLASGAFAPARIREDRAWLIGLVDALLDDMIDAGQPVDFHGAVATQLPNLVMAGVLGVPRDDLPVFHGWIDRMLALNTPPQERAEAQNQLHQYIIGLVDNRRRSPTDDLLSALVHAHEQDDRLTEQELVMLCVSLFLGGFDTTVSQLSSSVFILMNERGLWGELLGDPGLMPAAMEELWRWIPGHRYGKPLIRWATDDVELSGGVIVKVGEAVIPERPIANRDESVFPRGWEVDFHRDNPRPHLALGFGSHHCMGANLAHMEIQGTLERLMERLPSLRLAVPSSEITWSGTSLMRCVESLPLAW